MSPWLLNTNSESQLTEITQLFSGQTLKGLDWVSVIQPMTAPKPFVEPLTSGFRRTPVLQIGADVFCDTLAIAMELDRRAGEPAALPEASAAEIHIHATWAERVLMWPTARYVTALNAERLGADFFADRDAMRGHAPPGAEELCHGPPHDRAQLQLMLGWLEGLLADGRDWLLGGAPNLGDFSVYQRLWWLQAFDGRAGDVCWRDGWRRPPGWRGSPPTVMGAAARPRPRPRSPPPAREPRPLAPAGDGLEGRRVEIGTEDFAPDPVQGRVVRATAETITLARADDRVGRVQVHFPRLGYRVREMAG